MSNNTQTPGPTPYSAEEMAEMMKKDQRLQLSMALVAQRNEEARVTLGRLKLFMFAAIMKFGPVRVGPEELKKYKQEFKSFTFDRNGSDFILDIPRIIIAAPGDIDGTKDSEPVTQ